MIDPQSAQSKEHQHDDLIIHMQRIWGAALDWKESPDFQNLPDDERDESYVTYQRNVIEAACRYVLEREANAYREGQEQGDKASVQKQIHDYVTGDMVDAAGVARTSAMMLIAILCGDTNATKAEMILRGLTWKGEKLGDWKLTLAAIAKPPKGESNGK
jgi:hypothetical protein